MIFQSCDTKMTRAGAMSSCSVQPRLCQRAFRKAEFGASRTQSLGTSSRYAKQTSAQEYQRNIELMASESSVLLILSIQHVSTQSHW